MQFSNLLIAGLGLIAGSQAQPVEERGVVAHITFHGGPASYQLSVPADGTPVPTNNGISVDTIDADYNIRDLCTFATSGPQTLVGSTTHLTVGPPQPILSVTCWKS
ncbi:hypothetical protein F5B22DRAFT_210988 [Xylaria bambusicola]|uniref:uncharacterized protein n=1 Tax=Xylaria bambusicola TaxID=326684 RepID=UPI002007FA04|nr:uncharacterized protein F5B22DRAFT_210988 [Xylaria bambusicola]KAI0514968.1 hypothetical protein F5B22DRAFT_210988 [Xylaria bambusicola]